MTEITDAIISIYPPYADAILKGTKTVELRRRIPDVPSGTRLWIYATRPIAAVVGVVTIADVFRAHPRTIWMKHRKRTGVDHASFSAYFADADEAIAIFLAMAHRIGPITIKQLRKVRHKFHPPQVLLRLTEPEAKALRELARRMSFESFAPLLP